MQKTKIAPKNFSTATAKDKVSTAVVVASLEKQAVPIFRRVLNLSIKTKEDFEQAAESIKFLKMLAAEAERQEKEIIGPLKDVIKKTQALFKPFQTRVAETEWTTKLAMSVFLEGQKKLAAKLEEDFSNGKIKKVSTVVAKQNELRVENGTAQVRKVWALFIDDVNEIPRKFLTPDETAIREAFKNGEVVTGCRWEQVEKIAI